MQKIIEQQTKRWNTTANEISETLQKVNGHTAYQIRNDWQPLGPPDISRNPINTSLTIIQTYIKYEPANSRTL